MNCEQPNDSSNTVEEVVVVEDGESKHIKQRNFSIYYKLKVIEWYHNNGRNKTLTARHFAKKSITRQNVHQWVKMEDKLRSDAKDKSFSIEKRKRVRKERVPKFSLVEKGVYEWYSIKFVMQAYVSLL